MHSLKEQHCVNNDWQLKETVITLKHKDNLPLPFPTSLSEIWEEKKVLKLKQELKNLQELYMLFKFVN